MSYSVHRLSCEEDERQLITFWNANHRTTLEEKYRWIYEGNPAGKATVFLVKDDEDECVGCCAVFPRQVSVEGVSLHAGVAGDFLVHKEHRVLAPALQLARSLVSTVIDSSSSDSTFRK